MVKQVQARSYLQQPNEIVSSLLSRNFLPQKIFQHLLYTALTEAISDSHQEAGIAIFSFLVYGRRTTPVVWVIVYLASLAWLSNGHTLHN